MASRVGLASLPNVLVRAAMGQKGELTATVGGVNQVRPQIMVKTSESSPLLEAKFKDCILKLLNFSDDEGVVCCNYENNVLTLSPADSRNSMPKNCATLKHPQACPLLEMAEDETIKLPESVMSRGVALGVAVMVVSSDEHVLLSRRPLHMRTFPGIWVPPGGHVEAGETLEAAVLRELEEETGLSVAPGEDVLSLLAMWESAYPPVLAWGLPVRHHIVVYYSCSVNKSHSELTQMLKLDPDEVSVCAWLNPSQVDAVLNDNASSLPEDEQTLHAVIVSQDDPQHVATKDIIELFTCTGLRPGRISLGTQFALSEWLKKHAIKNTKHVGVSSSSSPTRAHL